MSTSFDELVKEALPELDKTFPVISVHQAWGILMEAVQDYWGHARFQPEDSLSHLVNVGVKTQVIAEFLFGLKRKTDDEAERYKKEYEYTMKVLIDLITFIQKNHTEIEPLQKGQAPLMSVIFDRKWLNQLIMQVQND